MVDTATRERDGAEEDVVSTSMMLRAPSASSLRAAIAGCNRSARQSGRAAGSTISISCSTVAKAAAPSTSTGSLGRDHDSPAPAAASAQMPHREPVSASKTTTPADHTSALDVTGAKDANLAPQESASGATYARLPTHGAAVSTAKRERLKSDRSASPVVLSRMFEGLQTF